MIDLLDHLKDDPAEYVRRSVANNLNDIAKDHPATVIKVVPRLEKGGLRRAAMDHPPWPANAGQARGPGALKVLGYTTDPQVRASLRLSAKSVKIGGELDIEVSLSSKTDRSQKLVVDYVVHHRRASGKSTPKVFKLRTFDLPPGQTIHLNKKHSFVPRSVRRYYPGIHTVELMVGGQVLGRRSFRLTD